MLFSQKFMFTWIAACVVTCAAASAQADTIVNSDSGILGTFSLTNNGGGSMTLNLDGTEMLTNINGATVGPFAAAFDARVALTVTPLASHEYSIVTGTLSAIFTDANAVPGHTTLNYTLTGAETGTVLADNAFLGGPILGIVANSFSGFDFSHLVGGSQNFALTSTHYVGGVNSMDGVFQTNGASAEGSIAFSQSSTPIPALSTPLPGTLIMATSALITGLVLTAFKRWRLTSA